MSYTRRELGAITLSMLCLYWLPSNATYAYMHQAIQFASDDSSKLFSLICCVIKDLDP